MKSALVLLGYLALAAEANGRTSLRSNNGMSKKYCTEEDKVDPCTCTPNGKKILNEGGCTGESHSSKAGEGSHCEMVAGEDYSGSSCTKVADASSGTNEDETDDTTGDCASCFDNDQFFCQDGAGYCVSTRAECKNDATMIKKVVGCSSIVDPVANDDEEPKPGPGSEQATDLEDAQAKDLKSSMDKVSGFVWGDPLKQSNCAIYSGTALTMMGVREKKEIADIDALCHSVPEEAVGMRDRRFKAGCLSVKGGPNPIAEMGKEINLVVKTCPYNKGHPEWFPIADCDDSGEINEAFAGDPDFKKSKIKPKCRALDEDHFERHMVGLKTETDFFPLPMTEECKGEDLKKKPCVVLKKWKNNLLDETKTNFKGIDTKYQGACALGHVFDGPYPLDSKTTFRFMGIMDQLLFKRYLRDFAKCLPKRCGCNDKGKKYILEDGTETACKAPRDEEDCQALVKLINEQRKAAKVAKDICPQHTLEVRGYDFGLVWTEDGLLDELMCTTVRYGRCEEAEIYTDAEWNKKCT